MVNFINSQEEPIESPELQKYRAYLNEDIDRLLRGFKTIYNDQQNEGAQILAAHIRRIHELDTP